MNYNATWLGATNQFSNLDAFFYAYTPINNWLSSIYHFDYQMAGDETPFYVETYLALRGVPIMYYQDKITALVETQWRALFHKNWDLIDFAGTGEAFDFFLNFQTSNGWSTMVRD